MPKRVSTRASLGFRIFSPGMRNRSKISTSAPAMAMATAAPTLVEERNTGPHTMAAMLPKNSTKIKASMTKPFFVFTGFSV